MSRAPRGLSPVRRAVTAVVATLPRSWAGPIATLQRDMRMVLAGLSGRRPPPYSRRRALTPAARDAEQLLGARTVRVTRVVRETPDAVSLFLADPNGTTIDFVPGQFLTFLVTVGRKKHRRAYSISSSLDDARRTGQIAVTVKRVPAGLVSNHLNDVVAPGDTFQVLGPSGSFTIEPSAVLRRDIVFIAGGSGITPVISIVRSVLAAEPASDIALLYGSRIPGDILFREALEALEKECGHRFRLRMVVDATLGAPWQGGTGLLDRGTIEKELFALLATPQPSPIGQPPAEGRRYYVCGPEPMMQAARAALFAAGVPSDRVHEEKFTMPHRRGARAAPAGPFPLTVRLGGKTHDLVASPGQTVLEAGLAAGLPMPFSCAMGGCGACKVRLLDGEVVMDEPNCLTDAERQLGYVLACVSCTASSSAVEVV